jgi:hypothetical protein
MYYTGRIGSGFGLIAMSAGTMVGVDAAGGTYDGEYESPNDQSPLTGVINVHIPIGIALVTGAISSDQNGLTFKLPLDLPPDFANGNQPVTVQTTTGPINVVLKKLRNLKVDKDAP